MEIRENLLYALTHEWIQKKNGEALIGISDPAQERLTDIVFVELPEPGKTLKKGDIIATLESVKSVAEMYAPFNGQVIEINERLNDEPGLVNSSPYDNGWIVKMNINNKDELKELLSSGEYRKYMSKDL